MIKYIEIEKDGQKVQKALKHLVILGDDFEKEVKKGFLYCEWTKNLFCQMNFFEQAYWMPVKKNILQKKVIFEPGTDRKFVLSCNSLCCDGKDDVKESLIRAVALLEELFERFGEKQGELATRIRCFKDNKITLDGCLPVRKRYFEKKYWNPIRADMQKRYPQLIFSLVSDAPENHWLMVCAEPKEVRGKNRVIDYGAIRFAERDAVTDVAFAIESAILEFQDALL